MQRLELTGKRFERLTAVSMAGVRRIGKKRECSTYWLCRCDCGNTTTVSGRNLRSGGVRSCGCLRMEALSKAHKTRFRHGHLIGNKPSLTLSSWRMMIERCRYNLRYIQRQIVVCDRWRDFRNFLSDMGERPTKRHTLDRYPNRNGNYEPTNCRWATPAQQAANRNPRR
jgi:hypothetical protein